MTKIKTAKIRNAKEEQVKQNYCHEKKKIYPVNDVLKTTSPTWVPEAPNDFARQIEPSSSTNLASATFHGLSTNPKTPFFSIISTIYNCQNVQTQNAHIFHIHKYKDTYRWANCRRWGEKRSGNWRWRDVLLAGLV